MKNKQKFHFATQILSFLSILSLLICNSLQPVYGSSNQSYGVSQNSNNFSLIILNTYEETLAIGDQFELFAILSTGKRVTYKSSNSKVASVNTYGTVTAKKNGTATITAKTKNAEASCVITVAKTVLTLSQQSFSLENGQTATLTGNTSNGSAIKFKSSKSSIASIDENGLITAKKPGETTITATADTTKVTCMVKVKKPQLLLDPSRDTLYRNETLTLHTSVSSGKSPTYKSNRKSVATVSSDGIVTAIKHGYAIITATVDGVSKICEVTVKQPTISLDQSNISLKQGDTVTLNATVSSQNTPTWTSSNTSIATVDANGSITGISKGTAYIYAREDGVKARCKVVVS